MGSAHWRRPAIQRSGRDPFLFLFHFQQISNISTVDISSPNLMIQISVGL
jgi:hypothetical protein